MFTHMRNVHLNIQFQCIVGPNWNRKDNISCLFSRGHNIVFFNATRRRIKNGGDFRYSWSMWAWTEFECCFGIVQCQFKLCSYSNFVDILVKQFAKNSCFDVKMLLSYYVQSLFNSENLIHTRFMILWQNHTLFKLFSSFKICLQCVKYLVEGIS